MRTYTESTGLPWYILSAEHGLVAPDEWLEPYDCYLPKMSSAYRRNWGAKVARQLKDAIGPLEGRVLDTHAGAAYVDALETAVSTEGAVIVDPLRGMPIGRRLSWYLHLEKATDDEASRIAARLGDRSHAKSLDDVVESAGAGLRFPGLYSWWVDDEGASDLSKGLEHEITPGLIYAGLAGATRKGGATSSNTLWGRI